MTRDWSSDVCSSDLVVYPDALRGVSVTVITADSQKLILINHQIGRASCRERVSDVV